MRLLAITTALTLAAAVPAIAQQTGAQPSGSQQDAQAQNGQRSSAAKISAMSQQKLRQSLQNAGFKDIKIVDAAYVVHARTQDGNFVVMYIDPPTSVTGQGTTGSGSIGSSSSGSTQQ
jgi:hypothetical protein